MKSHFPIDEPAENKIFFHRILFAGFFIFVGLAVLIGRYWYLQVYSYDQYAERANSNRVKLIATSPSRGYIYDRNGFVLASNKSVFTAMMSIDEVKNPERTLELLTPIFDLNQAEIKDILARIESSRSGLVTIKSDINEVQMAQFSARKPFFNGVSIQNKLTRTYPYYELFGHAIGYVGRINDKELKNIDEDQYAGTDLIGKLGIEKYYEDILLGKPGYTAVETNVHGDTLRQLETTPPVPGNDLKLTLDYGLQKVAQQQLNGRRGAIVAIDPRDGGVLAFVSNPSYDPNPFVTGISFKDYGALRDDPDQPLYNRALQGMYPPGSTIKPFEGLGGIHYGLMEWDSTIRDPGYFTLPGDNHRFRDWKRGGHGIVDLTKSIVESVDTYYYKLAYEMGIQRLHDWMVRFGFGSDTGIDLPNEKSGIMPSPQWKMERYNKDWLPGETISVSIGQGYFLATPLQIANATAILANQGKLITPHLLKASEGVFDVKVNDKPTGQLEYNGDPADWLRMHNAMEQTVERGTARGIFTPKYRIAGKTGTAQVKSIAQGERYNKNDLDERHWDHAWFNGFAPVDNPQIAVAVLVENGGGGSRTAAPIARKLFDYWILKRTESPILPPSAEEMVHIRAEKAAEEARIEAIRQAEEEARLLAEAGEAEQTVENTTAE